MCLICIRREITFLEISHSHSVLVQNTPYEAVVVLARSNVNILEQVEIVYIICYETQIFYIVESIV